MLKSRIKEEKIIKKNYAIEIKYSRDPKIYEVEAVYRLVIAEDLTQLKKLVKEILSVNHEKLLWHSDIYIKEEIITFTKTNESIKF